MKQISKEINIKKIKGVLIILEKIVHQNQKQNN